MKIKIVTGCIVIFAVIFCIKILPLFMPIKYAVKELPQNSEYFIVEGIKTTGYEWLIVGNQNGCDKSLYREINILGKAPFYKFYNDDSSRDNRYICYGEIIHDIPRPRPNMGDDRLIEEDVLSVDRWDIMYPVQRDMPFLSGNYICLYDIYYGEHYTVKEMLKGLYIWNYKSFIPENLK